MSLKTKEEHAGAENLRVVHEFALMKLNSLRRVRCHIPDPTMQSLLHLPVIQWRQLDRDCGFLLQRYRIIALFVHEHSLHTSPLSSYQSNKKLTEMSSLTCSIMGLFSFSIALATVRWRTVERKRKEEAGSRLVVVYLVSLFSLLPLRESIAPLPAHFACRPFQTHFYWPRKVMPHLSIWD